MKYEVLDIPFESEDTPLCPLGQSTLPDILTLLNQLNNLPEGSTREKLIRIRDITQQYIECLNIAIDQCPQ
jgi:hypothetical protein